MNRGTFFIHRRSTLAALTAAGMLMVAPAMLAQTSNGQPTDQPAGTTSVGTAPAAKGKAAKPDKVVQSKDTKQAIRKEKKVAKVSKKDPLAGLDKDAPDKQLYDKAIAAIKSAHYDVARLDLQVLLNTYQDTQYQQQAKLAMADSWFKEGGSAALDQAEAEYKDFITFFPNTPEAAEAQMRVGDIYFKEMDKVDRDDSKAESAEREYILMLQQFPDAPKELTEQATQRLRDVQEMLAGRMAETAAFYGSHDNRAAAIARYQTVLDTYPLYSHTDDVLIALGDLYEAQARYMRLQRIGEGSKAILEKENHDKAAAAYTKVVLEHSAAPHVEDAKDRLAAMDRPIPNPSAEQMAASTAIENSRASYNIANRAELLFLHKPDVVQAARIGAPTMVHPKPTMAPEVINEFKADWENAMKGIAPASTEQSATVAPATAGSAAGAPAAAGGDLAPGTLSLRDVPVASGTTDNSSSTTVMTAAPAGSGSRSTTGTSMGMRIVTPTDSTSTPAAVTTPAATPKTTTPSVLAPVGPTDNKTLPPIEKAAAAPEQHNEIPAGAAAPVATTNTTATTPGKKAAKPKKTPVDTKNESSSKKQPKKGLDKLNPF